MFGIHLNRPKEAVSPAYRQAISELKNINPQAAAFLAQHAEYAKEAKKLDEIPKNTVADLKTYRKELSEFERKMQRIYIMNKMQKPK